MLKEHFIPMVHTLSSAPYQTPKPVTALPTAPLLEYRPTGSGRDKWRCDTNSTPYRRTGNMHERFAMECGAYQPIL